MPPNATVTHTPQELFDALYHVSYEYNALNKAWEYLAPLLNPWVEFPGTFLMEAFLVHARNLNVFLFGTHPRIPRTDGGYEYATQSGDVLAEYYFGGAANWSPPRAHEMDSKLIKEINKQLAHISYDRKITSQYDYKYNEILSHITLAFRYFMSIIPRQLLHPKSIKVYSYWHGSLP